MNTVEEVEVPNRTIYVRESDAGMWEEAEKLAGGSLSGLIADAVRRYVEEEKRKEGMGSIEVDIGGHDDPLRSVRFAGEWLVHPSDELRSSEAGSDLGAYWGVALTRKGNVAVYRAHVNDRFDATLRSYPSFEAAKRDGAPNDILELAQSERDPDYVQELDI